jgi:hypothetical protein
MEDEIWGFKTFEQIFIYLFILVIVIFFLLNLILPSPFFPNWLDSLFFLPGYKGLTMSRKSFGAW